MESKLEQLRKQKENYVTRIFWMGLEIALIFAVPAALGVWMGNKLGGGTKQTLILAGTFIFSWVIVIFRFRSVNKKVKSLERAIQQEESNTNT